MEKAKESIKINIDGCVVKLRFNTEEDEEVMELVRTALIDSYLKKRGICVKKLPS